MKETNNLLFWVIGLPMAAIVWIAMVGPEAGITSLFFMLVSLGVVLLIQRQMGSKGGN